MKRRPATRPRLLVEELERRILYSADAAALLGLSGGSRMPRCAWSSRSRLHPSLPTRPRRRSNQATREIIFIDSRVPDAMKLADELMQQRGDDRLFDIVMLDADKDGIAQINAILANEHDLGAIHVISHGASGAIDIGSTRLDAARLAIDGESVARWGQSLGADGDLCSMAAMWPRTRRARRSCRASRASPAPTWPPAAI